MDKVFINEAFTKAINDYLKSSDNIQGVTYNSFLVVVLRSLVSIYSELDIVNPKVMDDAELLKDNLSKFGYSKTDVEVFLSNLQLFLDFEKENEKRSVKNKNPYFIIIQKELVDMLIKKKLNFYLTEAEVIEFYDLLYTPYSKNPLRVSYNFLQASDVLEVDRYFKIQMKENIKVILPKEKHYLNVKAYELLNYSFDDIKNMDSSDVDKVNSQVYDYFKIRENAINKEYLLDKAIEAIERENNKVTSEIFSYYLGDVTFKYKEALASEPTMSSIAHSVVLVRLEDAKDADKAMKEIKEKVDPRKWVCVGVAEENVLVVSRGDIVMLVMDDELAQTIKDNFLNLE